MNAHPHSTKVGGKCVPSTQLDTTDAEPGFSRLRQAQNWVLWGRVRSQHLFPYHGARNLSLP